MSYSDEYADIVGQTAMRALLYEACIAPKPGLVDRLGNGAHRDMDLFKFLDSGCALIPYFRDITRLAQDFDGEPESLLAVARPFGKLAETAMLDATNGVNTHKGLVFSMGIMCAAFGYLKPRHAVITEPLLFKVCAKIAGGALDELGNAADFGKSNGQRLYDRCGITGIRGEAAAGFPNVSKHGYPALVEYTRRGCSINDAGVIALLRLIANVDDTNMAHRSDIATMREWQERVRLMLRREADPVRLVRAAEQLELDFTAHDLSPGGCADLLAISLMVFFMLCKK